MADASILLDIVLADLKREDITRVQSQISQSFSRAVNLNVEGGGSGKLDEDMRRVEQSANKAGQSVSQLNNIIKRYNQNMLKAEVASERVEDQFKSYSKRINVTNRAYGELNAHSARLRQNENKNQKEINETETQMRQLRQEIQRLQKEQLKLRRTHGLDPFGKRSGGIRSGLISEKTGEILTLKQSFTTMEGIGLRLKSLISGQIGTLMLYSTAIMAVRSAVQAWVRVNVELENSQANLKTVTVSTYGDIDRSMAMAEERARELSHVVPLAAAKISESMYFLASGGLKDIEVMDQIAGSVILATSALIENKLAAETVTTAYNVWIDAALRGTEIADKFQITIARNQVTGEQLAESFKYVAATGKMIGYTLDEVLAITGALGTLGIRGSMAGTSLNQAFLKISKKQGILRNIGIEVVDSSGKLKKFINVIEEFRRHYGTTIDAMEQEELGKLLDIRAARGIIPFIENIDTLRESLENMGDAAGASMKAMLEQTYTTTSGWELLKNAIAEVAYKTFPDIKRGLWEITNMSAHMFKEALKTPEQLSGFMQMLEEGLTAEKPNAYMNKTSDLEKYIRLIQEAGIETKELTELIDSLTDKNLMTKRLFPEISKKFGIQTFRTLTDEELRAAFEKLIKMSSEFEKQLDLTIKIKKAMEGWKPFEAVAPFKVPEIMTFEDFYNSFQKRYKEAEEIDIFGVGFASELGEAYDKMMAANEKKELEIQKKIIENEARAIQATEDNKIASLERMLKVSLAQIELEKKAKLKIIDEEISSNKEKIETERKSIIEKGGKPEEAPETSRYAALLRIDKAYQEERKLYIQGVDQEITEKTLENARRINAEKLKAAREASLLRQRILREDYKLEMSLLKVRNNLELIMTPERNYEKSFMIRLKYLKESYNTEKEYINKSIDDKELRDRKIEILELQHQTNMLKLQKDYFERINKPNKDYISALVNTGGKVNLQEVQDEFLKLMATKNVLDIKMEEFRGTPVYQEFEVQIQEINAEMEVLKKIMGDVDAGIIGTEKSTKKWKAKLDDIPHAYSIISRSIQSMNDDMDESIRKILDMGEGIANMAVGLGTKNPIMAISGAVMLLESMFRKEKDDREQISKSAYEISKATQSGIRADYGQAQTINVQMSNAIKMDFLVPEGLTQGRQEQIAETLVDEMGRKLTDRGYL